MKKKILVAILCVVMMTIGGLATWAYFTDTAGVENTFTVGNVDIMLDEAITDEDGIVQNGRTEEGNEYHLVPAHVYAKDPTVTIFKNSDDCYVYVKLENGLKDIVAETTIEAQMQANGWSLLEDNIYVYNSVVEKSAADQKLPVFENFKIKEEVTNTDIALYKDAKIVVTAYAVQKDTFANAEAAWNATYGK